MLHDEGADYVLRRMFPIGGTLAPARTDWRLSISGWNCLDVPDTPNGGTITVLLAKSHGWADVVDDVQANPHGAYGAAHAAILGMGLRTVSMAVTNDGRSVGVLSSEAVFEHALEWTPYGDADGPSWPGPQWEPRHGFPWRIPNIEDGYWDALSPAWSDMLSANFHTAATFPVGTAFVGSPGGELLLASMRLATCIVIRPGGAMYVRYRGRLWPHALGGGAVVTTAFLTRLLERAVRDDVDAPDAWRAVLLTDAPGTITSASTWSSVHPITASGYAAAPLTNWAKDGVDVVTASCPGWTNTSGAAWPVVTHVGVVANFGEDTVLCWAEPLAAPLGLLAGDAFAFSQGVRFTLRDGG